MEGANSITGYRELSPEEIALINEIKAAAESVGALCARLKISAHTDARWVATATTDLQKGFMALTRAVARPGGF